MASINFTPIPSKKFPDLRISRYVRDSPESCTRFADMFKARTYRPFAIIKAVLIDTHCHLNHDEFYLNAQTCIQQAQNAGVQKIIVVGFDLASSERAVELAERFDPAYAAVGIHPHDAQSWNDAVKIDIERLCRSPKVVAVGEIGLDFYRNLSPAEDQFSAFRSQAALAIDLGLPIIVHCRDAWDEMLDEIERMPGLSGALHCFSGSLMHAQRGIAMGFYLGIGGVVTFPKAEELREIVRWAPTDRLLLETDAPYLAPVPCRGKTNLPEYIPVIAARIAQERGIDLPELAAQTTRNAHVCFPRLAAQ